MNQKFKNIYQKFVTVENALLFLVISIAGLLGFAFVLEYFVDLVPCPLCIVQRFFYLLIGITALLALIPATARFINTRITGILVSVWAIIGGSVAMRQVWLQHLPQTEDATGCAVSFGSFLDSALYALGGRGNCGIIDWTFISFSIAEWSLCWFVVFIFIGMCLIFSKRFLNLKLGE